MFSEVDAELSGVLAHYLGQAVVKLIGVSLLRQLAFKVIADGKSTRNGDKRHALAIRAETWRDPELGVWWDHTGHIGGAGKADRGHRGTAGIGHQVGVLGVKECSLRLAEIAKPQFVYYNRVDGPGMRNINLLRASGVVIAESLQQIWGRRLESCKRLRVERIVEVVVDVQILLVVDPVV